MSAKLLLIIALLALNAQAFAPVPPGDMTCAEAQFPNNNYIYIKCEFPPHISKYVSAEATFPQSASITFPRYPRGKLKQVLITNGWQAQDGYCDGWDGAQESILLVKVCHDHYPDAGLYQYYFTWGGAKLGENPLGWRMAAMMKYVNDNYRSLVDVGAGWDLRGFSYGGQTAHFQSMILPDVWARALVTNVIAGGYSTIPFAPEGIANKPGSLLFEAWGGYDWTQADIRTKSSPLQCHKITGATADEIVYFDRRIFTDVCDAQKRCCMGLWYGGGHGGPPGDLNLPFYEPYAFNRLDKPLPIFTHSSANYWGQSYGHYNLGLEWNASGVVDTRSFVSVPIRYRRHTGIGYGVSDQPTEATFTITLRRTKLNPVSGEQLSYRLGATSGVVAVSIKGDVTIPALTLASSTTYTTLEIWR